MMLVLHNVMIRNRKLIKKQKNENDENIAKYTYWLVIVTVFLVIVTVFLVAVGSLQYIVSSNIADSSEKMTNITYEFYRYHPPEVSLINGHIGALFVCQDKDMGTFLTIYGVGEVYNSAQSNDIALVRPNIRIGNQIKNGAMFIEGNQNYIPIIPGEEPKSIPVMATYQQNSSLILNYSIQLNVDPNISQIEVIHPIDKKTLGSIKLLEPTRIDYKFGEDKAKLNTNDYSETIQVLYFEDYYEYVDMKKEILFGYGKSAVLM